MFTGKKALLLDMNSTFMFGEDRFDESEDFSKHYQNIGGTLKKQDINQIIRLAYEYLEIRYSDEKYQHKFPSLESAVKAVIPPGIDETEIDKIINTFTFHELGYVPEEYREALRKLKQKFTLAVVIDIWSPKEAWLKLFEKSGITNLFSAMSFSSDHGIIKPSPKPFQFVLEQLGISNTIALVVGDSPRRDLGGAKAANIDCVLVGGAVHPYALASFKNLLEFCGAVH